MAQLTKDDLAQMDQAYLRSLTPESLLNAACNLRETAVELLERLEQNSRNSSKPPSSDNPFDKPIKDDTSDSESQEDKGASEGQEDHSGAPEKDSKEQDPHTAAERDPPKGSGRRPGKQPGAKGFWRTDPLIPEKTVPHVPESCAACNRPVDLPEGAKPHMGHLVLELELFDNQKGLRIYCAKHLYYEAACECGHGTKARPGEGYVSCMPGRKKDLKITEYVLVGPLLTTFIACLANWHRLSRTKIREFLAGWLNTPLSIGTIDRCIREAGLACFPVVEDLIRQLQQAHIIHLDETSWWEKGSRLWLWVAMSSTIAVFIIGPRTQEMFRILVSEAFLGWLVTDGYKPYRDHPWRQRCLAHLIRKAIGLSGAVDKQARNMGEWLLRELRRLIKAVAEAGEGAPCGPILARLKRACLLGEDADHAKLQALASEILNDWDAVVAFVKNPELPPTNNVAERALRHAVIARGICFGTRTPEGSIAYGSLLSVIQTCRLRQVDPWAYIAQTIARARKGLAPLPVPTGSV